MSLYILFHFVASPLGMVPPVINRQRQAFLWSLLQAMLFLGTMWAGFAMERRGGHLPTGVGGDGRLLPGLFLLALQGDPMNWHALFSRIRFRLSAWVQPRMVYGFTRGDGVFLKRTRASNMTRIEHVNKLMVDDNVYIGHFT